MTEKTVHEGRNVKRIREILGIKQDTLANELGLSQQAISALEQREKIDEKVLEDVAKSLNVPVNAFKILNEESGANYINSFSGNSVNNGAVFAFDSIFNPLEKYIEAMEEIKKLHSDLLKAKDDQIELLKQMVEKK